MDKHIINRILIFLILLPLLSCEEHIKEEEEFKMPEKYDISGTWNLYAWFPIDCSDCTGFRYDITKGEMILDFQEYHLNLHYTFYDYADSLTETGTFYYSSEYFVAWGDSESTLFLGDIDFYPMDGDFWTVRYRTGRPPDQYNQVYFRNFLLKNDTTSVMLYWYRGDLLPDPSTTDISSIDRL